MKKKIFTFLQLFIGIGLLFAIFKGLNNPQDLIAGLETAREHSMLLILGTLCFPVCLLLTTLRWQLFLHAQEIKSSYLKVLLLTYIGQFFSMFMLGSTGGDILKAVYVTRDAPNRKTEAVTTILVDRVIGLVALLVLCSLTMTFKFDFFMAHQKTKLIFIFNLCLIAGTAGFLFVTFYQNLFEKFAFFRKIEKQTFIGEMMSRVYNAFRICFNHPGLLLKATVLSFANHFVLILCSYCLGMALEIDMRLIDYIFLFPVINTIAALPVAPGGVGVRETIVVFLLGIVGVQEEKALLLSLFVYFASLFLSGIMGGIAYFFYIIKSASKSGKNIA